MGTMDKDRLCKTCMGGQVDCPGHFGHIVLHKPVYHGNLLDYIRKVLRCVCCRCSHLLCDNDEHKDALKAAQEIKNQKSRFNTVFKLANNLKECKVCETINHKYKRGTLRIDYEIQDKGLLKTNNDPKQTLKPEEAHTILSKISAQHLKMMGLSKERSDPANMIIFNLAVAPPPVRPSVAMTNTMRSEDDLTIAYKQIIQQNNALKRAIQSGNNYQAIKQIRDVLQFYVATVMDNDIKGSGKQEHKTGKPIKAIRARLKGKEGRLRGNLMGKRVDFSARTVITPDPNLRLDQLGVPKEIAMNLTIPEVVTEHNQEHLRQLVNNGPTKHPGAKYIKRDDGRYIDLEVLQNRADQHLEIGYTVERHLDDNDYVIFNRQPSLHKMSLMGHRVRVLDFQTFRLNLSVTTPYNADFDGDEMNMHVPQSLETKAEIKEIMAVPRQIVAPRSNKPCMGIVQDSLLGIMRLTLRDTFLDKAAVMNLLMFVDYDLEKGLPHPAILKPKALWTGKQIISLVIPNSVNFERTDGGDYMAIKDDGVVIEQGELLSGILHKGSVGASDGGLIHITWKDLGPQACCDLLSNIQYVVNNWLVTTGFTVGVADIIAKPEIVNRVQETIHYYKKKVRKIIQITQNGKLKSQPGKSTIESFEHQINTRLNNARNKAGDIALKALASDNRLKNMVNAGSKGSNMNISQIMACVGQQNVEGKRIPFGFHKRALPHFTKDDFGPESKGFVENSYLTGLTPSEFYFHAMGGREGLIDTAVKTADTGYISRRLMKALEDVMVKYDGTVRTSQEVLIQFLYGEDGMAGEHFEKIKLDTVSLSNKQIEEKCNFLHNIQQGDSYTKKLAAVMGQERANEITEDREIQELFRKEIDQLKADRTLLRDEIMVKEAVSAMPLPVNIPRLITNIKMRNKIRPDSISDLDPRHYFEQMQKLQDSLCVIPQARLGNHDSLIGEAHYNSMILFKMALRRHLCSKQIIQQDRFDTASFDQLCLSLQETFQSAIVHAGEMVGSIGAQSMGEPATQMTLNTFHNAGISSKNVTLGVPRLKEVINVAKTIKTPSLKIFLADEIQKDQAAVVRIGDQIQYQNLSHIVSDWGIYYDPDPKTTIIREDEDLIENYQLIDDFNQSSEQQVSRWVLRFKIDDDPMRHIFDENFEFRKDVGNKIDLCLNGDSPVVEIIYSTDEMDTQVIRIRPFDIQDDEEHTVAMVLRELADYILHQITLRGFEEITKVSYTSNHQDCTRFYYEADTGAYKKDPNNWIIETDGVALAKVFAIEGINAYKTVSNSILETLQVLGIEASRQTLINELRQVLGAYSIYVNYRHMATLVDVMTQRGILTSITRHGINRVNSGPLRKCSFEETTEILLEAAFFGEHDPLSGITENVIFGQLAPYGTGAFDLIVDRQQLANCIESKIGFPWQPNTGSVQHTPDNPLTPTIGQTPNPYMTGGQTPSIHTPNPDGDFTPAYMISPAGASPAYGMMDSTRMSPAYGTMATPVGAGAAGKSPVYGTTPVHGYAGTPAYVGGNYGGEGAGAAYSPAAMGGASQHSSYSPTNIMKPFQSPGYSPTTPNYGNQGMTPIQHSTPTYNYGGPTTGTAAYQMPNISSPSVNPAVNQGSSPQISVASGSSNHQQFSSSPGMMYSGVPAAAYNPASPSYGTSLSPMRGAASPMDTRPAGGVAYNPEGAVKGGSDSSDSDDK